MESIHKGFADLKLHITKSFAWDISECILHYYQATGKCEAAPSASSKKDCQKNGDCPTQTIITVMACDVEDACAKIKGRLKNFKLEKLVMFDKPALTRDSGSEDPLCNTDVTPDLTDCFECCELLEEDKQEQQQNLLLPMEESSSLTYEDYLLDEGVLAPPNDDFHYYGSGTIIAYGEATIDGDDLGELVMDFSSFENEVTDAQLLEVASFVPTLPLPQTTGTVQLTCCPIEFSLAMELRHTLNRIKRFASFIKTNDLFLPGLISGLSFIKLNYNVRNDQWQGNLHFSGQSSLGNFDESWDFGFQFGCDGVNWKFSMIVANTQPNKKYLSRMLVYYKLDTVCPNAFFGFKFSIDVDQFVSDPSTNQPVIINDDAGFFRNLKMAFRILPQNQNFQKQILADNTEAYDDTFEE